MSKELETIAREWLNSVGYMHLGLRLTKRGHNGDSDMPEQVLAAFAAHVLSQQLPSVIDAERTGVGEYVVRFGSQPPAGQIRPAVQWFAQQMEAKLRKNDHKGGWEGMTLSRLMSRLDDEVGELYRALSADTNVIEEASDVANFAMMIADNAGPHIGHAASAPRTNEDAGGWKPDEKFIDAIMVHVKVAVSEYDPFPEQVDERDFLAKIRENLSIEFGLVSPPNGDKVYWTTPPSPPTK
jgi:NTP pyrophosphatase (non-canonical NTP hydrolase)